MKKTSLSKPAIFVIAAILAISAFRTAVGASAKPKAAHTSVDRGAFIMVQRGDTAAIERFVRTPDSISVDLTIKMQGRFVYVAHTLPDLSIDRVVIQYFMANAPASAPPAWTSLLTLQGDDIIAEIGGGAQKQIQRWKTAVGAVMLPALSVTAVEQLTMKQRRASEAMNLAVFATSGGITAMASVTPLGNDSIIVAALGTESRLSVDRVGHILGGSTPTSGMTISRVAEEVASKLALARPDYSAPPDATYVAEEVKLPGPAGTTLGGTMTLPRGVSSPVPVVVTITGSGQQDRDEFIPIAGGFRPFRQVADVLSNRGIAVLRLDDRGIGSSNGNPMTSTSADFADDIRAAVTYLQSRREIDPSRIALVGHSEGAIIAPMVAANDKRIKALVLLAGPADNGRKIIEYQQRYSIDHDAAIAADTRRATYRMAAATLDSAAAMNPWLKFFLSYAPDSTARKVKVPVLILQGATDRQVPAEQAEKLGAAIRAGGNRDVTVRVFPGLNHLFIADAEGNPANYSRLTSNQVDEAVLGAIADWLGEKLRTEGSKSPRSM
ncbi:MAG: alpha/beta hydrolase family protein [Gemmatimonadaceae bacterium]